MHRKVKKSPTNRIDPLNRPRATFVDPLSHLCSGDECLYRSGGHLIYFDNEHFSDLGSARAVLAYFPLMRRELAQ